MDATAISSTDLDVASLVLRLALGPMLVLHGLNKVQGGLDGTAGWFESLGLKPGWLHARVAAFTEIGAGSSSRSACSTAWERWRSSDS